VNRRDLDLPPELTDPVARRRQAAKLPEAARARLHRRLTWAFTPEARRPVPRGLFQRLLAFRLAALPASLIAYLPLAVAGIGVGAASLSVVHVLSRPAETPARRETRTPRVARPPRDAPTGDLAAIPPLPPLPETVPTPEPTLEPAPGTLMLAGPRAASSAPLPDAPPSPALGASVAPLAPAVEVCGTRQKERTSRLVLPASPAPAALERQLLEQARTQLRSGAISGALATLAQHRALYPESQLTEEREVLAIEATVRSNGPTVARPMVDSFRQRFPRSPLLPALEDFLKSNPSQSQLKGVP
jgi:hypothetical protein